MSDEIRDVSRMSVKNAWSFIILLLVVFIIWGLSWLLIIIFIPDWPGRSDFGDMFGAVNALFSGAALAGVIFAIILQKRELQLQRRELEMTRQELKRSTEAQEKSERALNEQANTLLMTTRLNALNSIVEAYDNEIRRLRNEGHGPAVYKSQQENLNKYFRKLEEFVNEMERSTAQPNNSFNRSAN